jgi:hypothetical protein
MDLMQHLSWSVIVDSLPASITERQRQLTTAERRLIEEYVFEPFLLVDFHSMLSIHNGEVKNIALGLKEILLKIIFHVCIIMINLKVSVVRVNI